MGINAGASAITGVYLGDQLLTNGGDIQNLIQAAIDGPKADDLLYCLKSRELILDNYDATSALLTNDAIFNELFANDIIMPEILDNRTALRVIADNDSLLNKVILNNNAMRNIANNIKALTEIGNSGKFNIIANNANACSLMRSSRLLSSKKIANSGTINDLKAIVIYCNSPNHFTAYNSYGSGGLGQEDQTMYWHKSVSGYPATSISYYYKGYHGTVYYINLIK